MQSRKDVRSVAEADAVKERLQEVGNWKGIHTVEYQVSNRYPGSRGKKPRWAAGSVWSRKGPGW
jgi:hypothetical protein